MAFLAFSFVFLVFAVVLVNGFTDAPNAVSTCISSRSMTPRGAILLAGVFNFLGATAASLYFSGVAETVYLIVDFGEDSRLALSSLFAGMCAVVLWAMLAFFFGIPTSESHALISGIVGAALGGRMSPSTVRFSYLLVVFIGLLASTVPAYFIAKWIYSAILGACSGLRRRRAMRHFYRAQRLGAASSAFLHGAQDSQKFVGVIVLGMSLYSGAADGEFKAPLGISLLLAAVMTLGTLLGGSRIIKKVGEDMVSLDAAAGSAADISSSVVLLLLTLLGIPVSTTHSKTSAMMGAGALTHKGLDKNIVKQMVLAWLLTFPCCAVLGFILGYIFK